MYSYNCQADFSFYFRIPEKSIDSFDGGFVADDKGRFLRRRAMLRGRVQHSPAPEKAVSLRREVYLPGYFLTSFGEVFGSRMQLTFNFPERCTCMRVSCQRPGEVRVVTI
jgi:hypothetical protein